MRLALSSAAAPDAAAGVLLEAASRRGLAALELVEGHGHGIDPGLRDNGDVRELAERARSRGVALAGYRLAEPADDVTPEDLRALAAFGRALQAPLVVPWAAGGSGLAAAALAYQDADVRVLLPACGDAARSALQSMPRELGLAWEADPSIPGMADTGAWLAGETGSRLGTILLRGGGPEATEQTGRGVGSLMTRLAVSGWGGTVVLAPSSDRYRVIWDAWLGRRGGWGCGSRSEDRSLVTLGAPA